MGKVIKIIDEYNILINLGENDGVNACSLFEVYETGEEIVVEGVNYGTLDNIKATLEVKAIYPKMAVCQSDKVIKKSVWGDPDPFSEEEGTYDAIAPLKVDKKNSDENLAYFKDKTIVVGDLVRDITEG